jgi:hypothetical protein
VSPHSIAAEDLARVRRQQQAESFSGRANIPLAEKIAHCLGDSLGKVTLSNFPDGGASVVAAN